MRKFEMLNVICKDCELTAKEKLVAQYFVYKSNKSGACYPCVNKIAEDCSVSRRTVQRATKKLAEKEYIIKEERFKFGKQTSNLYTFNTLLFENIMQREKEIELESRQEKANSTVVAMEVIELEELLNIENTDTIIEADQESIDLDDLIMSGTQEEDSIECAQEEVPFKEPNQEQINKEEIFFSVSLLAWFICILDGRDIQPGKGGQDNLITIGNHNSISSIASRKIMGAFFPP
ncbi:helix-turn-helix domain-containing protein [[Clostridium] polysaccharolyticum]|uniref:Helix-turn-helix domain-containing protein n=1 Tax=[Clostridium] polysaccharolyticum TaxID=29364 RepID=A0A1H9Y9C6_9FIRM|nr:helix-turn-helix domain-containing protein [[Clostridium] polysaccharolyticum]SES65533.1 Helix-turn-helix domain-containing protein [[Clostridium] polysaccharolyticum]